MKITLIQEEIHEAVEAYVRSQINIAVNQKVAISFTAGRGENGLTAELDIRPQAIQPKKPATYRDTVQIPASRSITNAPEAREEPEVNAEVERQIAEDIANASIDMAETGNVDVGEEAPEEEKKEPAPAPRSPKSIFSKAS